MRITIDRSSDGAVSVAGAPLFTGDAPSLLTKLEELRVAGGVKLVVTPNVDQIINLDNDELWREVFRSSDLRIIDGAPVAVVARIIGRRRLARHTGASLLPQLAQYAQGRGQRVAIVGDEPIATRAAEVLREAHRALDVVPIGFPWLRSIEPGQADSVITALHEVAATWVFVCIGSPKQEQWVHLEKANLPPGVYIGAGAAVDFVAGVKRRAPRLFQRLGIEWMWRLLTEPKRMWRRYLVKGPRFVPIAVRSILWSGIRRRGQDA